MIMPYICDLQESYIFELTSGRARGEMNPADLESAESRATMLGRKRYWFDQLIKTKIDNSGPQAKTIEMILLNLADSQ